MPKSISFATAWTIACKTPLSMGFPRQEYSSGLPIPSSGDPPGSGVRSSSPARPAGSFALSHLICAVLCLAVQSCPTLHGPMDYSPPRSSVHRDSPGKNTDVGFHALLQGIFPSQGSNPGLPLCGQILYHLSYQGSPATWSTCHQHFQPQKVSQHPEGLIPPPALSILSLYMSFKTLLCVFLKFSKGEPKTQRFPLTPHLLPSFLPLCTLLVIFHLCIRIALPALQKTPIPLCWSIQRVFLLPHAVSDIQTTPSFFLDLHPPPPPMASWPQIRLLLLCF